MTRPTFHGTTLATRRARERGAVAIIMGIVIVVLVGMVGLALDLGKLYVAKSELQNSADACALAAARDLTGATPLIVSEAAGITAGSRNQALFQQEQVQLVASSSVTYTDSLDNPFLDKDSVSYPLDTIKYVRCDVSRVGIAHWFAHVLNAMPGIDIGPSTVAAFAVATTTSAQTACAIPVFVCRADTANPPVPGGYTIGQWLTTKSGTADKDSVAYGGGNFGWADLTGGSSAKDLANQLKGAGQCNLPSTGTEIGTTGDKASLADEWNSRFGIVKAGKTVGVTDFTGFAYTDATWTAKFNAYNGSSSDSLGNAQPNFLAARGAYRAYQGDGTTGLDTQGNASAKATHEAGADRRLVLAPIVDCSTFGTGGVHKVPVTGWACLLMVEPMQKGGRNDTVRLEYRGTSTMPGSPCATQGMPGAGGGVGPLVPVLVQ
ncbi:pilus assembly protein TadG-related protein [Cupriavidus sp. WGtm5]|uniref:TadE/TadG family type IV pilus assembly protein n=1 Tax=Cupriavidus sp. WGtm5 TaxID=2919926 RepID=UPI002090CDE6|nr:pilus assembly protein TadG-related protein [Cupriavidus sp. WGtm5]MCO4891721.1 pilus assembly protein TadG-related protein [Cupriavidus sp. WGtm5]